MKIISKKVSKNEYETEVRYFAETDDGFDGSAQGYGYKSEEKLQKAYWWYKNGDAWKDKVKDRQNKILTHFRTNKEYAELYENLVEFFHPDNAFYLMKDGNTYDKKSFLDYYSTKKEHLNDVLQTLHIRFSSLADFFTSLYEEEEKLKQRRYSQVEENRKKNKNAERRQNLLKKYGNDFFDLRKKITIYCKTNDISCPHTNAKIHEWFKHLPTEKQETIRNITLGEKRNL